MVSIRKNGQISFNSRAVQSFSLDRFKYVDLYFDKTTQRIGIQLTNTKGIGSRKITILNKYALISGGSFCKHFGIDTPKAKQFEPTYKKSRNMIIIRL